MIPNFRESDPSKIAVGFGGTLNLITGLLFLLAVFGLMAAPYHVFAATAGEDHALGMPLFGWMIGGIIAGIGMGVLATVVPLRLGTRSLQRREF
jgi:ABC-2 type transport system permease protein